MSIWWANSLQGWLPRRAAFRLVPAKSSRISTCRRHDHTHRGSEVFFIFGSPRSGTTLLAQTLAAHSQIEMPYETDFIVPVAFVLDRVNDPTAGRPIIKGLMTASMGYKRSLGPYLS